MKYLILVLLGIITTGCSRVTTAAHDAFFNPNTLIPLVGAGVFSIGDFDEKVSRWATKHCPIYGTPENAADTRQVIKDILEIEMYMTALAASDSRLERAGVDWLALKAVHSSTSFLKQETNRARPNGANDLGFPSGCTSKAFASATLSNRNIGHIDMPLRRGIQFGNIGLASSVGWSRIESGVHYPSDVLAGAALGHFLSAFIHDAILDKNFTIIPLEDGLMARLSYSF